MKASIIAAAALALAACGKEEPRQAPNWGDQPPASQTQAPPAQDSGMFNMLLAPGTDPAFPDDPENHKGIDYRLTPPTSACRSGPYSGIGQTLGRLSRNAPVELRPIEPVAPPRLPRRP